MGYSYSGRGYSYSSPDPVEMEDYEVDELIETLKKAIDNSKLKDMRSALSQLKLSINDKYPMFTRDSAPFGAYIYAVNNKKKKAADSLLKTILKKNFEYDGIPLELWLDNLSATDMNILNTNYLADPTSKWKFEDINTIEKFYKKFPQFADALVNAGRLNMYAKGEERMDTTKLVIELGSETAILAALHTMYGIQYIEKYGISQSKMDELLSSLDNRSKTIGKKLRQDFFYKFASKSISVKMMEEDDNNGMLDNVMLKHFTKEMFTNHYAELRKMLRFMENDTLRVKIITSNEDLMNHVVDGEPNLLPQQIKDIFLF